MKRYAVIVTEKVERDDGPIHWLLKGTVVEIVGEGEVECVSPCYGVDVAQFSKRKHKQFLNPEDIVEIEQEQAIALARSVLHENLYKA